MEHDLEINTLEIAAGTWYIPGATEASPPGILRPVWYLVCTIYEYSYSRGLRLLLPATLVCQLAADLKAAAMARHTVWS